MEYIVGGSRAITPRILPVEMMVVYKGPVENDAPVGLERAGDHVGGVRRCSAIKCRFALTLMTEQPLIPMEASKRAYSRTRVRSVRTFPLSKKMERPPYPRSIPPSMLSHWSTQRSRA